MTVAVVGSLWAVASAASEPPNIIFILSDDLSYRDLGCYDQQHIETPNLDRLCREAIKQAGGAPKYTEYSGVGHNSWSKAYASSATWEWLFMQRRSG